MRKIKGFLKYHIKDRLILAFDTYLLKKNRHQIPVLVFTMAKVGSLSMANSIKKNSNIPVFHIHSLDEEEINRGNRLCLSKGIYPGSRSPVFLINKEIVAKQRPYNIISLFRNPIERNISAFFDAFELFLGVSPENYRGTLLHLEEEFFKKISHNYAIDWYGKQFFQSTGINVYDHPFDVEKQFTVLKEGNVNVLLMHSEISNAEKEAQVREFCQLQDFKITNANVTTQTKSASLYKAFRSHIRFSDDYLKSLLNSDYANHFFSEEYKERLFKTWSK